MALVESCCESISDVLSSREAGAHRIELCIDLASGGQTPSPELVRGACDAFPGPVMVLVRPRDGDFVYTPEEIEQTVRQIERSVEAGAAGVVVGCLDSRGRVNTSQLRTLIRAAGGLPVTFHKAFDEVADLNSAFADCAELGVARILTSGGQESAVEGVEALAALVAMTGPTILVGGGVRADHIEALLQRTGAEEVHARASAIPALMAALA